MKKILLIILFTVKILGSKSQINHVDFGTSSALFSCDPPVFTTTGQIQCLSNNPVGTTSGNTAMYYTTDAGSFGQDCRNWMRLSNPGFTFIGTESELQLRNAGGGNTINNPARFVVKNFTPGSKFGITFEVALVGLGGEFIFRCGAGEAYGDTIHMLVRDTSSFLMVKFDNNNPAISPPFLSYSGSAANPNWPNAANYYYFTPSLVPLNTYQKHNIAIFCNNTNTQAVYNYLGLKTINAQSYDVYIDSVLDLDNMKDTLFGLNRGINSFMFCGSNGLCANGGPYLGDTLIVDNIFWTSDFLSNPLPVRLTNFRAQLGSGKEVLLSWGDMNPSDLNSYEVQVSSDSRNFSKVGTVKGTDYLNVYSFSYKPPSCGQLFFRLQFDGNKTSETLPLNIPCDGPKIRGGKQLVSIETKTPGSLMVFSFVGQSVSKVFPVVNYKEIPINVSTGMYLVRFVDNKGMVYTEKVIIQ